MKKYVLLILVSLVTVTMSACTSNVENTQFSDSGNEVSDTGGSYTNISAMELQPLLENKDFTFINVHIPFEGDIPETDLSIPFDQIEANIDQLPADKDAKIVLYCRSGSMSRTAAKTLVGLGYTNVWNLSGGFNAWKNQGYLFIEP